MASPVLSPEAPAGPPAANARPTGVTILALVEFATAGLALLGGLFWLTLASAFLPTVSGSGWWTVFAVFGAILAVAAIGTAVLAAIVAYGLWSGKVWGWYLQVVLIGMAALGNLVGAAILDPFSIMMLLVNGGILWYLFQPQVRRWFGQNV